MLTELAWHAVGCSSWNGYRCSEWWRYSSLRAGPVAASILVSILSGRWGLWWRVNVADDARSWNGLHRILWLHHAASACYSLILGSRLDRGGGTDLVG